MPKFLQYMLAALIILMAAHLGAQLQTVIAERDYYRDKAQQLQMRANADSSAKEWERLIKKYNPKF